ncbi:MAG: transglutaminase domain-containing protein [Planctomycetes bacterium]|nr:transglutaminase domain-containing protein [Planctomycetota bacterium]
MERRSRPGIPATGLVIGLVLVVATASAAGEETGLYVKRHPRKFLFRTEVQIGEPWQENLGILVYLPYPESTEFQQIEHINHRGGKVVPIPRQFGEKSLRYYFPPREEPLPGGKPRHQEERPLRHLSGEKEPRPVPQRGTRTIVSEFVATLWDFAVDFDAITELHPYDTASDLYQRYTMAEPPYIDPDHRQIVETREFLAGQVENELEFARRAFEYVKTNAKSVPGRDVPQPLADTLRKGGGAKSVNAWYVSLLRSYGIPARVAMVRRINKATTAYSEFYLEGYGWIPADPSIRVEDDYYFGKVMAPPRAGASRSQHYGVLANHVYGDFTMPVPYDWAAPVQNTSLLTLLIWGTYHQPRLTLTIREVRSTTTDEEETDQPTVPMRRFTVPLE